MSMREKLVKALNDLAWTDGSEPLNFHDDAEAAVDAILDLPEIKEALEALDRENSYSSIFDGEG